MGVVRRGDWRARQKRLRAPRVPRVQAYQFPLELLYKHNSYIVDIQRKAMELFELDHDRAVRFTTEFTCALSCAAQYDRGAVTCFPGRFSVMLEQVAHGKEHADFCHDAFGVSVVPRSSCSDQQRALHELAFLYRYSRLFHCVPTTHLDQRGGGEGHTAFHT